MAGATSGSLAAHGRSPAESSASLLRFVAFEALSRTHSRSIPCRLKFAVKLRFFVNENLSRSVEGSSLPSDARQLLI